MITSFATRTLGRTGPAVSSPGLGCMGLSGAYGDVDEDQGVRVIHDYLDAGGTLLDTGDFYGAGHNETLIARALRDRSRDDVVLSVKFGALLDPVTMMGGIDTRPVALRNFLTYSLRRLGTDHVDVYRPARLDPAVPIEETVGAIADLVEQGLVRHIGLSEVGAETIRRAAAVAPICDVQLEYSVLTRGIEDEILDTCRELGIGITAYGVLGRGMIGGGGELTGGRAIQPRFQGDNRAHNEALVSRLEELARAKGATIAQLAIAWVHARGDDLVPIIGARRPEQVATMIDSAGVVLDQTDLDRIDELIPPGAVRGERYPARFMADLDSERRSGTYAISSEG
ncbi:aldo/keto reductase [Microlunatus parietis]|uniref:Aryl-alcohol dehydrogenase-like predicted oxidoreductase n=1 Tax=Microlunatus parietis TaxID=682979 RepID=A0A7Y9ICF1_9ACTN|nr:aldo/keto reductase [Microlunatus parietis]NYE74031.1 aryl-alcohol dehydrogenase-like predicted oxidoreductase [Microlunatus parietis]